MILNILHYGNPLLRTISKPVVEITSELIKLSEDMLESMYTNKGVGLAAIQTGNPLRLLVADIDYPRGNKNPHVLFNPEIIETRGNQENEEGCLSIPGLSSNIVRADNIKIKYLSKEGQESILEINGYLSQCIQHEMDHHEGILYIDRLGTMDRMMLDSKLKKISRGKRV